MSDISINENLLRRIVRAIDKAVSDDVPQYLREHHKETNNAIVQLRGDYINENLRRNVEDESIGIIPFRRHFWHGRLLVDKRHKITYSITTQANLHSIPKKDRAKPHFLQSILAVENGDCQDQGKQETLFPMDIFDRDILENDYNEIIAGMLDPAESYRHYVISYQASGNELVDVKLEFLDSDFSTIAETSLNEYIKPDFARLTDVEPSDENTAEPVSESVRKLLGVKRAGVRPALRDIEKEA